MSSSRGKIWCRLTLRRPNLSGASASASVSSSVGPDSYTTHASTHARTKNNPHTSTNNIRAVRRFQSIDDALNCFGQLQTTNGATDRDIVRHQHVQGECGCSVWDSKNLVGLRGSSACAHSRASIHADYLCELHQVYANHGVGVGV